MPGERTHPWSQRPDVSKCGNWIRPPPGPPPGLRPAGQPGIAGVPAASLRSLGPEGGEPRPMAARAGAARRPAPSARTGRAFHPWQPLPQWNGQSLACVEPESTPCPRGCRETAKIDVGLHAWFKAALEIIVAGHSQSRLDELLPWYVKNLSGSHAERGVRGAYERNGRVAGIFRID